MGPDVVYAFTPACDMAVTASTCGSHYDTVLYVGLAGLAGPTGPQIMFNDDDRGCAANQGASRLDLKLQAGRTYYFAVDGYAGSAGQFMFTLTCTGVASNSTVA